MNIYWFFYGSGHRLSAVTAKNEEDAWKILSPFNNGDERDKLKTKLKLLGITTIDGSGFIADIGCASTYLRFAIRSKPQPSEKILNCRQWSN